MPAKKSNVDHYETITARIVAEVERALDEGTEQTWTAPWTKMAANMPFNAATGRRYNGVNAFLLGMDSRTTADPRWCTYKQAQGKGWQVRKGEKSTTVYLFRPYKREERDDEGNVTERPALVLRTFSVFHASQMDGIPAWEPETVAPRDAWEQNAAAERVLKASGADITYGGDHAYYTPALDTITLPTREQFGSADGFYATALHELAHWTGGKDSRVPRREGVGGGKFGTPEYAREEIRADMASAVMRGVLGIVDDSPTGCQDTVAYVRSWLRALKDDKYEARRSVADAQKIADFLLGDEGLEEFDGE